MRLLLLLFLVVPVLAQPLWTPEHFWSQQSGYAGARACAGCHADIYRKQEASHHALSLRPLEEVAEMRHGLPFEILDRSSGAKLELNRGAGGLVLTARKEAAVDTLPLLWAFGSGVKGITPVGRLEGGDWVEARLSWYAEMPGFDFTTGATKFTPRTNGESLGRRLHREEITDCLGCHTTGTSRDRPEPDRNNMGVRCERCHGPGAEHIRAMQKPLPPDKKIFHPGTLDGSAQAQMCGVCHGMPPQETDFQAIRFIQRSPNTVRFPSQRLVLSRCFTETDNGLRCTTCHDPHGDVSQNRAALEKACLTCHSAGARRHVRVCPVAKQGCSSCHMPKQRVMAHSEFADHWIRVLRDSAAVQ